MNKIIKGTYKELTRIGKTEVCDTCGKQYIRKESGTPFLIVGDTMFHFCSEICLNEGFKSQKVKAAERECREQFLKMQKGETQQ